MILDEIVEDKKKRLPGHMARIPETEMRRMAEKTKIEEPVKEPAITIEQVPEMVEEKPVEVEPIVEEVPKQPAVEEKPAMPDLSDPNKTLSPDEIAALFANMSDNAPKEEEILGVEDAAEIVEVLAADGEDGLRRLADDAQVVAQAVFEVRVISTASSAISLWPRLSSSTAFSLLPTPLSPMSRTPSP